MVAAGLGEQQRERAVCSKGFCGMTLVESPNGKMAYPCTKKDFTVLEFIWKFSDQYKNSPPPGMMISELSLSSERVYRSLYKLQEHGYIDLVYVGNYPKRFIVPLWKE